MVRITIYENFFSCLKIILTEENNAFILLKINILRLNRAILMYAEKINTIYFEKTNSPIPYLTNC